MQRLKSSDPDFKKKFARLVEDRRETDVDVTQSVLTILGEIRARGDDALAEFTMRYDDFALPDDHFADFLAQQIEVAAELVELLAKPFGVGHGGAS